MGGDTVSGPTPYSEVVSAQNGVDAASFTNASMSASCGSLVYVMATIFGVFRTLPPTVTTLGGVGCMAVMNGPPPVPPPPAPPPPPTPAPVLVPVAVAVAVAEVPPEPVEVPPDAGDDPPQAAKSAAAERTP